MKQNVKVAKQLVKLAKRLLASDGSVSDLAQGIYECAQDGTYSYSFRLPSGAIFCITDAPATDGYYECAIVSDFGFGMPEPGAFWFYDMNDIASIHEDDDLQDCKSAAQQIFGLDKDYRFDTSEKEQILSCLDKLYGKEYNEPFDAYDDTEVLGYKWYVYTREIIECIEKHFDKYVSFLNQRWLKDGVRCFTQAMYDMYEQYLSSPMKKYGLKENEYDDFEIACESLYYGNGFKASDYTSDETRAQQIYNYALDFMGNYD